jgi:hypothetical protein
MPTPFAQQPIGKVPRKHRSLWILCAVATACGGGSAPPDDTGHGDVACPRGYTGDGSAAGTGCADIDACATGASCDNFACVDTAGSHTCDGLFAVEPFDGVLARLDPKTYRLLDLVALRSTGAVTGVTAMARHPVTGTVYVVAKVRGVPGRAFGALDLATGAITVIASIDRFSSLAFVPDGTLYGVTGAGASVAKTLYTIDTTTGTTSLVGALGHGADGEVICYDSDAALMVHWTGDGSSLMESFPLAVPLVVTGVSPGISGLGEVFGCQYAGNHGFLVYDINNHVRLVTSDGVVSTPPDAIATVFQPLRATLSTAMTASHSVRPLHGPAAGGTSVTLRGIGLTGATAVTFGGVAAAAFTVVDDTTITAVTAAGTAGIVDVAVTTPLPYASTWPAAFTFDAPGAAPAARMQSATTVSAPSTATVVPGETTALQRKASHPHAR